MKTYDVLMRMVFATFICCFLVLYGRAQVDLANGLVAWLPFTGNTLDVSGNGNHGFATNGGLFTSDRFGQPGGAFQLDGVNDFVRVPDPGTFSTTPFSVSIWVKTDVQRIQAVVGKRDFGVLNQQQFQIVLFLSAQATVSSAVISNQIPCSADLTNNDISRNQYPDAFCTDQWHSMIVTYDGSFHRLYFDGVMVSERATSFSQMLSCNADIRIGNWWSGDPLSFQGKVDDFRWYNRQITADEIRELSSRQGIIGPGSPDFTMSVSELCDGTELGFQALPSGNALNSWTFGDGSMISGNAAPVHRFSNEGRYSITLRSGSSALCLDSITKTVDLVRSRSNLLANPDTSICSPARITPRATNGDIRCAELNGIRIPGSFTAAAFDVTDSALYSVEGISFGAELVANGRFEAGNTGFTSSYSFSPQRNADGQFGVVSNAQGWDNSIVCVNCSGFPTTGPGNFLIADGSANPDSAVWRLDIPVVPNTNYQFGFWAIAYDAGALAVPVARINGKEVGSWLPSSGAGRWAGFSTMWNSGTLTSITLSITNRNASAAGNRFGLDSISFRQFFLSTDSFTVRVRNFQALLTSSDTAICPGSSVPLSVSGGSTYQWLPADGLDNPAAANPNASPTTTTRYLVRSALPNGCTGIDSVLVTVFENPAINLIEDTAVCTGSSIVLRASGAGTYSWSPAAGLSSTSISSPTAAPVQSTRYRVRFTESSGCVGEDSVLVLVNANPQISASGDAEICAGERTSLQASGGTRYVWSPAAGLSDPRLPNPVASPSSTRRYYVQGFGVGNCFSVDSVLVLVGDTPTLSLRSDTVLCQGSSLLLAASGAQRYEWTPAEGLSDPFAAAPVAAPRITTLYTATGFGPTGCIARKSVRIGVGAEASRIFIPNVFTPNGDGLNDCFQVSGGGAATVFEFAVFNRFGERVFQTRNPNDCWDGNFRGLKQPEGTFAYYLVMDSPCGPARLKGTITLLR